MSIPFPQIVFLNDFEFDDSAKKWAPWQYSKNIIEGEFVEVARPKNRGGDAQFSSDAPVFMTAPQEVALYHGKKRDDYETAQMSNRIDYIRFTHEFKKNPNVPEVKPCGHCGARVYLEGFSSASTPALAYLGDVAVHLGVSLAPSGGVSLGAASCVPAAPSVAHEFAAGTPAKKTRLATEVVQALSDAKALQDAGCISSANFNKLRDELLGGD